MTSMPLLPHLAIFVAPILVLISLRLKSEKVKFILCFISSLLCIIPTSAGVILRINGYEIYALFSIVYLFFALIHFNAYQNSKNNKKTK